ncbi:MAG: ATP-binding protein, partial [Pseudorhizobium sp.]
DQNGRGLVLSDLEDVRLLAGPAITGRNQVLDWQSTHAGVKVTSLPGATVRQALLNLVLNASAAAGDGGKISVETTLDEAGYLIIAVSDSGPGLGDAAADVLTSQAPWPAAQAAGGLGLWMVRRLVDDVGGQVDVCGGDTNKTVITLRLPFSACKGGAADAA